MAVQISVNFEDVSRKLGILKSGLRKGLLEGIGQGVFKMVRTAFEREQSPEGEAWAPLNPAYAVRKARLFPGRPILQATRALSRTIFSDVQDDRVIVGSAQVYAAIHQKGGEAGRKPPFKKKGARRAQIPARPFLPGTKLAEEEAQRLADEVLEEATREAGLE